jgi:hypothetical protein
MWIKTSLIAVGLAGAMVAGSPTPGSAQGVYIAPGAWELTWVDPATTSAVIAATMITPMSVDIAAGAAR